MEYDLPLYHVNIFCSFHFLKAFSSFFLYIFFVESTLDPNSQKTIYFSHVKEAETHSTMKNVLPLETRENESHTDEIFRLHFLQNAIFTAELQKLI